MSTLVPSYCSTCELLPELILELSNLDVELPVLLRRSQLGKFYPDFQKIERENSGTTRWLIMIFGKRIEMKTQLDDILNKGSIFSLAGVPLFRLDLSKNYLANWTMANWKTWLKSTKRTLESMVTIHTSSYARLLSFVHYCLTKWQDVYIKNVE